MSVDLCGPFQEGQDQEHVKAKYMLMASVTIPVNKGEPLVQGLKDLGHKLLLKKPCTTEDEEPGAGEQDVELQIEDEPEPQEELDATTIEEIEVASKK